VIALVRFDELKTTVQDVSKKSVQIHDLWKDISYYSLLMTYYESSSLIMRVVSNYYESSKISKSNISE